MKFFKYLHLMHKLVIYGFPMLRQNYTKRPICYGEMKGIVLCK